MIAQNDIPYKITSTMVDKFKSKNRLQLLLMYKTRTIAKTNKKVEVKQKERKKERKKGKHPFGFKFVVAFVLYVLVVILMLHMTLRWEMIGGEMQLNESGEQKLD